MEQFSTYRNNFNWTIVLRKCTCLLLVVCVLLQIFPGALGNHRGSSSSSTSSTSVSRNSIQRAAPLNNRGASSSIGANRVISSRRRTVNQRQLPSRLMQNSRFSGSSRRTIQAPSSRSTVGFVLKKCILYLYFLFQLLRNSKSPSKNTVTFI